MNDETVDSKKLAALNSVSGSFCLAKWMQVTLDIVHGTTHSCHHPQRHLVTTDELKANPSALHNSNYKKDQRKKMLSGERPAECSYCWDMEDAGVKYSDRFIKSTDPWAWPHLDTISKLTWNENVTPSYLEVMIDNKCNFSCAYCMADISSSIANEIKTFGVYPVSNPHHRNHQFKYDSENHKIYSGAFKEWFQNIKNEIQVLRITGGEPFLSPELNHIFEILNTATNPSLTLAINSHLSHKPDFLAKYLDTLKKLISDQRIGSIEIYVSLDNHGEKAEYIRHGLNFQRVISNLNLVRQMLPQCRLIVMCTFNILSIYGFMQFLEQIRSIKETNDLILDISNLKNPEYLRSDMATLEMIKEIGRCCAYMEQHSDRFSAHERAKLLNVYRWVRQNSNVDKRNLRRADFFKFVNEYDKRKNKSFISVFPEYKSFYIDCKKALLQRLNLISVDATVETTKEMG